jgi:hypothetical protein
LPITSKKLPAGCPRARLCEQVVVSLFQHRKLPFNPDSFA